MVRCCKISSHSSSVISEKQYVFFISLNNAPGSNPSLMANVQRYCSNTSKHNSIGSLLSMAISVMACFNAATSNNSNECVGRKYILLISPGRCPLLPALCKNLAMPLGEPTCITVSTGRKSTPRSRLDVQTTAFNFSVCKDSSTHKRSSCSILP